MLELEVEVHVVDAGRGVDQLFGRDAHEAGQHVGGPLHAVAEADGLDLVALSTDQQTMAIGLA